MDYPQFVENYDVLPESINGRHSPAECTGIHKEQIIGSPNKGHVSTSYVERQNLKMRMHMRRFTRLTNGFSKKAEDRAHVVALRTTWYHFTRQHRTLSCSPAMAAGLSTTLWRVDEVVAPIDV